MADVVKRQISRRSFLAGLGAAGATALIAACTPTSPGPAASTPGTSTGQPAASTPGAVSQPPVNTQPITLRHQARTGSEEDFFADRATEFNKKYPNITVKTELTPGGEYIQKLQTLIAGGTVGDVFQSFAGDASFQRFAVNGSTIAIDQFVSQKKIDLNEWFKPVIEMCKVEGKLAGLPFKGQPSRSALFYNQTLIEAKGQQVPTDNWTVDDLTKMARAVSGGTGNDATYGYSIFYNDLEAWNQYAITFGAPALFSEDGKKALINTEPVMNMFKWMYDMVVTYKASPNPLATNPAPGDLFNTGKIAAMNSNWGGVAATAKNADANKFKWGVVQMPKGPTGKFGNMVAGDMQGVTKFSKTPSEAFDLVYFFCNKDAGIKLPITASAKGGSTTPGGRPDVYDSQELKDFKLFPAGFAEKQSKVMAATTTYFTLANYRGSEFIKAVKDNIDLLVQDKEKPTKAFFDKVNADAQAVLDLPRV